MRKWMVEFLKKIEKHGIKSDRVNFILSTISINLKFFTLILYGVGVRCYQRRFSVHSRFMEKSMLYTSPALVIYWQSPGQNINLNWNNDLLLSFWKLLAHNFFVVNSRHNCHRY